MATSILMGICTSNDGNTLESLLDQCFSIMLKYNKLQLDIKIKQIIVVSSGSTDQTNHILRRFKSKYENFNGFIPIIEPSRKGKTHAVNQILQLNQSDFMIFIPADVSITFSSINYIVKKIREDIGIGVVSARPIPNLDFIHSKMLKTAIDTIWLLHNETLKYTTNRKINSHSSGELMILRKNIIRKIPDHIINEDAYIALKAKLQGYQIGYEPKSIVKIEVPNTLTDYLIQRKRILAGHNQISHDLHQRSSNFKVILRKNPIAALKVMKNTLLASSQLKSLVGMIYAIIIELRIELDLKLTDKRQLKSPQMKPIWRRINSIQPKNVEIFAD